MIHKASSGNVPRIYIQQNSIPKYRIPIFRLLSQCTAIEFSVIADTDSDTPYLETVNDAVQHGIRHIRAKTRLFQPPGLPVCYWQSAAVSTVRAQRPDVIIALGSPYSVTAWALGVTGRLSRIPVLFWTHGLTRAESGPKWWLRRALYRLANGLLLYGDNAKKLLVRRGLSPETLHVVYNSLDHDTQQIIASRINESDVLAWRRSLGVNEDEGLVIFAGRLQPAKRLDMLLEATAVLANRGRRVHIAIIGAGSQLDSLTKLAAERGITELTHFLGASYDEEFLGLAFTAGDLAVVPSNAGLSVIHALAYGAPVVLHDRPELHGPEWEAVEEGVTGFYYRYNDLVDLADKIEHGIFPVPKRREMATDCRRVIDERYNPHRQVEIIVNAVKATLAAHRKGSG